MTEAEALFKIEEDDKPFEMVYDADRSLMPANYLGDAILGMSTVLKIAGRSMKVDFEDVYVYPVKEGSVKTLFVFVKRTRGKQEFTPLGATVVGGLIVLSFQFIGEYGIAALKNPSAEIMAKVDKQVLELCMNADYRKSVTKIARPIGDENQNVKIKVDSKGYEIDCNNQYKFIDDEEEPILPDLKNGEKVSLPGTLTRMNLVNNDMGFNYEGNALSIIPNDPKKSVAEEYHQFLPIPRVIVTGIVTRDTYVEMPKIKVISIVEANSTQTSFLDGDASDSATKK